MSRSVTGLLIASLLCATAPFAAAQHVWIVDPAGGPGVDATNVNSAVLLASPGDIVLIRSGLYGTIKIDGKGISLVADAGASVTFKPFIASPPGGVPALTVRNVPAGQQVLVFGVTSTKAETSANIVLENNAGSVWLEECVVGTGLPAVSIDGCAAVTLRDCTVTGYESNFIAAAEVGPASSAVVASASSVALDGCTLTGGKGHDASPWGFATIGATPGAAAVTANSGSLCVARSTLTGGQGGKGLSSGGQFLSCHNPKEGGSALLLGVGTPSVRVVESALAAGANGAPAASCPPLGALPDTVVVQSGTFTPLAGDGPALGTNSPVREGQTVSVTLAGAPGIAALLVVSLGSDFHSLTSFSGTLSLALPAFVFPLGALSPGGSLLLQATVPDLGAGLEGVALYLQGASFDAGVGHIVLGQPTALTLLDASL